MGPGTERGPCSCGSQAPWLAGLHAIGIGGTRWKIFTPALLISLLISDSILVAVGAGVSQGAGLFLGIALLGMFALATISGLAKRKVPK